MSSQLIGPSLISYLQGIKHCVSSKGNLSQTKPVTHGVAPGALVIYNIYE